MHKESEDDKITVEFKEPRDLASMIASCIIRGYNLGGANIHFEAPHIDGEKYLDVCIPVKEKMPCLKNLTNDEGGINTRELFNLLKFTLGTMKNVLSQGVPIDHRAPATKKQED